MNRTRHITTIALLLVGALAVAPAAALAQAQPPPITRAGTLPTFHPTEYRGANAWFDPVYKGQGWSFTELMPSANGTRVGVGVSYTYDSSGAPSWLLLQGSWQRESAVRPLLDGSPVAVLTGPVFDSLGGACPTCLPTDPSLGQRLYQNGRVTFHRPDVATVELDGTVALSGEGVLVPSELVLVRGLPDVIAGRWRFTLRGFQLGNSFGELNYDTHGCELNITRVPSPSTLNLFEPEPGAAPFWVPPSGADVVWLAIDDGFNCSPPPRQDDFYRIAIVPGSSAPLRGIALRGLTSVPSASVPGATASYVVPRTSRFIEIYLQDPNTMIIRRIGDNNPNSLSFVGELLLTRAP